MAKVKRPRPASGGHRHLFGGALFCLFLAVATGRLFIWPIRGKPANADAVIMFNGSGDRLATAVALARSHVAPNLVVSRGAAYWGEGDRCAPHIPGVRVICFDPAPSTTRGEAEFAGRLASKEHWRSIVLVTSRSQDTRARLRMARCFHGRISVVTARLPVRQWPFAIVYEWGATLKAAFVDTAC